MRPARLRSGFVKPELTAAGYPCCEESDYVAPIYAAIWVNISITPAPFPHSEDVANIRAVDSARLVEIGGAVKASADGERVLITGDAATGVG